MNRRPTRILALSGSLLLIAAAFFAVVRPWYRRWGATDAEVRRVLAGDEILPNATVQETRAITIDARVEDVWPWVAQLGQDRGGFYSFDLLENVVGCEMPTVDRLRPEKQSWKPGDKLWMYPPEKAGGVGFATLRVYLPGRALGFGTHVPGSPSSVEDGSWSFVVEPIDESHTRFLVRGRGVGRSLLGTAFDAAIFEPIHFVMERRTMIGIQQLAQKSDRRRLANHAQVALWTITLGLMIFAAVLVIRRDRWRMALGAFVVAAIVFQVLALRQPPILVGAVLVLAVIALLRRPGARFERIDRQRAD
jgi:hypothetical protein